MDSLISVFLPVSLAVIMLSLGLGLTIADFARIIRQPRALVAGLASQVIVLPIVAYLFVKLFGLTGELAFGIMILSVCPGGVTSNILTKLVGGTLALSIALTGVVSLLSVVTVPLLVVFWAGLFMDTGDLDINVTSLAIAMFAITTVPVLLGMTIRKAAPALTGRIERGVSALATVLFVIIVLGALAASWDTFMANVATLAPLIFCLVVTLLLIGWMVARAAGLPVRDRAAVAMETGIQNATLGITLAGLMSAGSETLPVIALPAAMYGIVMYLGALPGGYLMRRATKGAD